MHSPRPLGHIATLLRLSACLLLCALTLPAAFAQTAPAPTTPPAVPAATPANPSDRTAVPAPVPVPEAAPAAANIPTAAQVAPTSRPAIPGYAPEAEAIHHDTLGSAYIPVDSPIYPMALRLYSLGYLDTAFINMRPWTRRNLLHMVQQSTPAIMTGGNDQAIEILAKLDDYLAAEDPTAPVEGTRFVPRGQVYGVHTLYTRVLGIDGQTLRDSYHLGQTIANDYGRPYEPGFNNITGFSTLNEYGRFSLYVRGEYQGSPSGTGYSNTPTGNIYAPNGTAEALSYIDQIPYPGPNNANLVQATIPSPIIASQNTFALQEAVLSYHLLNHDISLGKSDYWDGPGAGSAMNWSNNAQDIYSFRINRTEPLHIPLFSSVFGPMRYDFMVGSLKGHTDPNSPWVHSEMISVAPTSNFQFAFSRTVIWGGLGHEPITIHTFLRSFFNFDDTVANVKSSAQDPGARYSDFSFSWRLPFVSHHLTLYTDSICHDDVTPISAPRRAAYRPGIFLSQIPGLPRLDLRVEGSNTDVSTTISNNGMAEYFETIQKQGYTNKGYIMGDWIGRQAKGGEAWLTYHLSGNEWVQLHYLDKKVPVGFVPGGTTQGQFKVDVVKRFHKDVELDAWVQYERWKAPIYLNNATNATKDTAIAVQLTWFPKLHTEAPGSRP